MIGDYWDCKGQDKRLSCTLVRHYPQSYNEVLLLKLELMCGLVFA